MRIVCADLDGTMAGDAAAEANFFEAWRNLPEEHRPLLIYNTGRLIGDLQGYLPQTGLPTPDVMIGGVGTMLADLRHPDRGLSYARSLGPPFDAGLIADILKDVPDLELQTAENQNSHKSSWFLRDADEWMLDAIRRRLTEAGLAIHLVYSSRRDLDILPAGVNKGAALTWLCRQMDIGLDEVVVSGDTDNDRSMFDLPEVRGVVVANALPELQRLAENNRRVFRASRSFADGVLEGLAHFGVFPDTPLSRNSRDF